MAGPKGQQGLVQFCCPSPGVALAPERTLILNDQQCWAHTSLAGHGWVNWHLSWTIRATRDRGCPAPPCSHSRCPPLGCTSPCSPNSPRTAGFLQTRSCKTLTCVTHDNGSCHYPVITRGSVHSHFTPSTWRISHAQVSPAKRSLPRTSCFVASLSHSKALGEHRDRQSSQKDDAAPPCSSHWWK